MAINVLSPTALHTNHWRELKTEQSDGTIRINIKGIDRLYNVKWNENRTQITSVERDCSDVDRWDRFTETISRWYEEGLLSGTIASRVKAQLTSLSTKVQFEDDVQQKRDDVEELNAKLRDIDTTVTLVELNPTAVKSNSIHKIMSDDWKQCGKTISEHHNQKVAELKKTLAEKIRVLDERLINIKNTNQLSSNFDPEQIDNEIAALEAEITQLNSIHAEHQKLLNSFFTLINTTESSSMRKVLWARTKALSDNLLANTSLVKTDEEKVAHQSLVKEQIEVAKNLYQKIEEYVALFELSINKHTSPEVHQAQVDLKNLLKDHLATWNQINAQLMVLSKYYAPLLDRPKKQNEVVQFIEKYSSLCTQQTRLNKLIELKDELIGDGFDRAFSAAKRHMLAIEAGVEATTVLEKTKGKFGLIEWTRYSPEKQTRINSLIAVENMCLGLEIDLTDTDLHYINNSVNEHGKALKKGTRTHERSSPGLTYEQKNYPTRPQHAQLIILQTDTMKLLKQKEQLQSRNQIESVEGLINLVDDTVSSGMNFIGSKVNSFFSNLNL